MTLGILLMPMSAVSSEWIYSVRPGDTLWDLCKTYTTKIDCPTKLGERNHVSLPKRLPPGYLIRFPRLLA